MDGTLIDTVSDIGRSANCTLAELSYPQHPIESYKFFVGEGVKRLFSYALPDELKNNSELIDECAVRFNKIYANEWNIESSLYAEIPEMLDELSILGIEMSILSNKPDAFTKSFASEFLANWEFMEVAGHCESIPHKPDPTGLKYIMEKSLHRAEAFSMLGDTKIDVQVAKNAGIFSFGASWGFRPKEELLQNGVGKLLARPFELLDNLDIKE